MRYLNDDCDTRTVPASHEQLIHFRLAAIVIGAFMLTACVICVIFIKRNIVLAFSLKIISVIVLINIGFICNQIFSEINETVASDILQAISQAAISQYVPMGQTFTQRQWQLFKAYQIKFSKRRTERLKLQED